MIVFVMVEPLVAIMCSTEIMYQLRGLTSPGWFGDNEPLRSSESFFFS